MSIRLNDEAEADIRNGRGFYDRCGPGVGGYFVRCIAADLESLKHGAGIHPVVFGFHRALSRRFPFGIYYLAEGDLVRIYGVLDLRRDPAWIRRKLGKR